MHVEQVAEGLGAAPSLVLGARDAKGLGKTEAAVRRTALTGPAAVCGHKRAPQSTARPPAQGRATSLLSRPSPFPVSPPQSPFAASTRQPSICSGPRNSPGTAPAQRQYGRRGAAGGHHPGLGRSKEAAAPAPVGELVPSSFLAAVVDALELGAPVVISPSLSGMYSLPFLTAPGSQLRGYVPVAPICTDKINAADYASVKTSALIVYGDQDPMGQTSFEHLKQLPNHRVLVMEGAGHPCYLDKPEEWHTRLLDFLQGLA
ncbi:putative protein-lysine deacylase ABHD14B isoform X1 [Rhinolophus ferrumequinum]|uniref:putative protein-lysine deacylase ABHD14B isoform X1 n=1 Tax=Rhinolophus ferrumequinum TaxID=59479 RepID=UPI00140FC489|nr:putative protein-lysine deacylase ABHD14B isoform X1 [Rhinolophus ferrumequinum]